MTSVPNITYVNPNNNGTCGLPRDDAWTILREPLHSDMPWPGFLLGQTPASIWYWCADQMMVQKALSAKSLSDAQGATILTGWIKVLPMFLIIIPGMMSRVLFPDTVCYTFLLKLYQLLHYRLVVLILIFVRLFVITRSLVLTLHTLPLY